MSSSSSTSAVEITLAGLTFHVCVGILPHERELPQPLEIDVVVRCRGEGVLDYRDVHDAVLAVVSAGPVEYLETIAATIADRLLALPQVTWSRVAMRKPNVMLGTPLRYAQVAVERAIV